MEKKEKPSRKDRLEGVVQRTRQTAQTGSEKVAEKVDAITPEVVQRATRAARGKASEAVSTLTATNIEEKISEYSELYTQVLLGIHKDAADQAETLARLDEEVVHLRWQARSLRALRVIAAVAIVLSVVSLGGVVWLAL